MTETITSAYTSISTEVQAPSTVYKTSTLPASTITQEETMTAPAQTVTKFSTLPAGPPQTITSVSTAPGKFTEYPFYCAGSSC